ncbi:flagellar hook protein FlgE [Azoarcus taiwanensis]|uniref:Flagellar hook protein FlgE n=1 Tax=Azoarcus taiwanensis TaxID=666964 RepID=A0A972F7Q7_9RHOO|nr:flagellar hook protein FlgE [Azoarcus taiwanensis]NMG02930.1 flagellar hook-basal body complex protein [Azoarcus taiwanensis]
MAFQQGLSGLASSSRAIDVVSNNIANSSTVGFKGATAQFADVYASALTGAVSTIQVGIGATVNAVKQAFTQGNLTTTSNPLDMAINGNGFFRIQRNDGTFAYTRNGQFDVDREGYIITAQGERLTGYQVDPNGLVGNVIGPLRVPQDEADPQATGSETGVSITANLDSREGVPTTAPFDPLNTDSYNSTTSLTVYDSLGNPHTLSLYFVRTAPEIDRTWEVYASLDGDTPNSIGSTVFQPNGRYDDAFPGTFNFTRSAADLNNGAAALTFPIDLSNMTQFGSTFSVTEIQQDGYASGQVAGFAISRDGIIQGRYTNGQTRDLGQVTLVTFRSPNGLISLGNNLWAASPESGAPVEGRPGAGLNGVISAGQVEDSNVDLTQELVQLIIQQRNYQANAQSIRTQDQLLQTLVNLR